ncbi:MAG: hypothetical protein HYR88_12505 [Verrucomicrobia bacterium]|nr:hypothetical protein [Verrucomicrobiota bacterium]MBI3867583.1 hypothetical protein [Verrucomicrobiota bacterium]
MPLTTSVLSLLSSFAVLLIGAESGGAAEISGKWRVEFDTQIGKQKYLYELNVEGGKVTGKAVGEVNGDKHTVDLKNGKLNGDEIGFTEEFEYQGNAIRIDYTGKIHGEEIQFTRKVGDFATEQFVAKREKPEAPAGTPAEPRPRATCSSPLQRSRSSSAICSTM